jgi:hypothetical protein
MLWDDRGADHVRKIDTNLQEKKKKYEPPAPPPRVGKKQRRRNAASSLGTKLPNITPTAKCKLRLLKLERVKDWLLMEEEFVQNQERLKPADERNEEERTKVGRPLHIAVVVVRRLGRRVCRSLAQCSRCKLPF